MQLSVVAICMRVESPQKMFERSEKGEFLYIVFLAIKKTLKGFHSCGDVGVEFPCISTIKQRAEQYCHCPLIFLVDIKLMDVKLIEVRKFGRCNSSLLRKIS